MTNMDKVPMIPKTKKGRKVYDMVIDDNGLDNTGVFAISLVEDPAIESDWIYMSKQKQVKLAEVSKDRRLLLGPVLIPNKEIPRVDDETGEEYYITFSPETIEKAAHLYLQNQHNNNATLEHEESIDGVSTVESWVIKDPKKDKSADYGMHYPAGTWMAMMKVNNDEIWNDFVKTGKVKGFSVEAMLGHQLVKASKMIALEDQFDINDDEAFAAEMLAKVKETILIELGYEHNTGYRQAGPRETTRGYGYAPAHSSSPTPYNSSQPFALEPGYGGPTPGSMYDGLSNYDGIGSQVAMTHNDYPEAVKNNARKVLERLESSKSDCLSQTARLRTQQLAEGAPISSNTLVRMYNFLNRKAKDVQNAKDGDCIKLAYDGWGGKEALAWSQNKLKQLKAENLVWGEFRQEDMHWDDWTNFKVKKPIDLASYPWDECIADQTEKYGAEAAEKICGYIKAQYGSKEENLETSTSIASSYSGQFGSPNKNPIKSGTYEVGPDQNITNYFYKTK